MLEKSITNKNKTTLIYEEVEDVKNNGENLYRANNLDIVLGELSVSNDQIEKAKGIILHKNIDQSVQATCRNCSNQTACYTCEDIKKDHYRTKINPEKIYSIDRILSNSKSVYDYIAGPINEYHKKRIENIISELQKLEENDLELYFTDYDYVSKKYNLPYGDIDPIKMAHDEKNDIYHCDGGCHRVAIALLLGVKNISCEVFDF